ncbi:MAG TPA: IclR family transcriptional regulator [Paucimonas sp.]|nr:IclR family transcriptional regulator [Paucimonas sp.]
MSTMKPVSPGDADQEESSRGGVQSVEIGLDLFKHLVRAGKPIALSDLARAAGMHRAKAHRYLASLMQAGFVRQDESGQYDVGSYVLDLSIAYLARQSPIQLAAAAAARLAIDCNETCFVAVWGGGGATVIRLYKSQRPVAISIAEGTVFNLTMSATGRVFAAYLPSDETAAMIERELAHHRAAHAEQAPRTRQEFDKVLDEIRREGVSRVRGLNAPGIDALAAPVFDAHGRIVLALTIVGPEMSFDVSYEGEPARLLCAAARGISAQLGFMSADPFPT